MTSAIDSTMQIIPASSQTMNSIAVLNDQRAMRGLATVQRRYYLQSVKMELASDLAKRAVRHLNDVASETLTQYMATSDFVRSVVASAERPVADDVRFMGGQLLDATQRNMMGIVQDAANGLRRELQRELEPQKRGLVAFFDRD